VAKRGQPEAVTRRLREIAEAIGRGASPVKFEREIDQLLGTGIPERDEAVDAAWEYSHRPRPA